MSNIERIKCGNGNAFIVIGDESSVLVDTCHTQFREMILEKCREKNVKLIVLTHGHFDHIQNAAYLSKELNAPIAMHKDDYGLIKNKLAEPILAHNLVGKFIMKLSQNGFEQEKVDPFEPKIFLKDGDSLYEYGVLASVVELPGHTKGSIGIKVGDADIIVGDALMNMPFPMKSPLYGNRDVMEESAAKISAFGDVMIHFGHGKSSRNRNW
jgi:glyoxylase-like metal-dependent hydrolase (beta-lactamase superfamily II)